MLLKDNSLFIPVQNPNMTKERTKNARLTMEQRISSFDEIEKTYTVEEAAAESARCLGCPTHWCQKECPAGVPVTDFIAKARAEDYEGAYALIRTASMLPEFCSRLCPQEKQCQSNCTRSIRSQALGIGKLERFVVEQHYASGKGEATASATGKRIAVIGSGPSGLSAAQRLTDLGHAVTVYEKADRIGGLLEYGIPNMKLEKGLLDRKVNSMKEQGVQFVVNTNVDASNANELTAQYDAVVLAVGTGNARTLKLIGADGVKGIVPAVTFLTEATRALLDGSNPACNPDGKNVVIVGGGDTGSDCVGTAVRGVCKSVTQIEMLPKNTGRQIIKYPFVVREKEKKTDTSLEEYIALHGNDPHVYETTIKAVSSDSEGNIQAVTTVSLHPVYDAHFHLSMQEIPGTEKKIPCDLLVIAAGFLGPQSYVCDAFGVDTTSRSNIAAEHYATSTPKVFACGDCRTGQSLVVKAMTDGRSCADAVDQFLKA